MQYGDTTDILTFTTPTSGTFRSEGRLVTGTTFWFEGTFVISLSSTGTSTGTSTGATFQSAYDACYNGTPALYTVTYCTAYANAIVSGSSPADANIAGAVAAGSNVGNIGMGQPISSTGTPYTSGSTTGTSTGSTFQSAYDACYNGTPALYTVAYCTAYANAIVSGSSPTDANIAGAVAAESNVGNIGMGQPISSTGTPYTSGSTTGSSSTSTMTTGQLAVWTSRASAAGEQIGIYIDGAYAGLLLNYFVSGGPSGCTITGVSTGTVLNTLSVGSHTLTARDGNNNVILNPTTVSVTPGGCLLRAYPVVTQTNYR